MSQKKSVKDIPSINDKKLFEFWEKNEPEDFVDWEEGDLSFRRPPKKLIQLRLDPKDARTIDRESKRSGIDRAQLIRSWVREKIAQLEG